MKFNLKLQLKINLNKNSSRGVKKGFTLIELLLVLSVVSVLFIFLINNVKYSKGKLNDFQVKNTGLAINSAVEEKYITNELKEGNAKLNWSLNEEIKKITGNYAESIVVGKDDKHEKDVTIVFKQGKESYTFSKELSEDSYKIK